MTFARLSRFERESNVAPIDLMERDRDIIRHIKRHRFLRSPHIIALAGGSAQQILRRLQLLYHHGYVDRPRAQIEYYNFGGSKVMAYGLGNKGAALLSREAGLPVDQIDWTDKNRTVRQIYLAHALGVADVMVVLELACRKSGRARILYEDELMASSDTDLSIPWKVDVEGRKNLGIVPDRVFGIDFADEDGESERAFFFLEADQGTMPVIRENLSQSSFYRKLLAYEATWAQGIHRKRFGFHRFQMITVTTSAARVQSLVDACSQLRSGHGLFLFADRNVLTNPDILFSPVWRSVRGGEMTAIIK